MLRSLILSLVVALAVLPTAAQSAAVVLWPVDPTIKAGQSASAVWIENKGATPVMLQVRTLAWSQQHGEELYSDQNAVVASPPVARIAAGQRQLVRIIRRADQPTIPETSYRLLVDELPAPLDSAKPESAGAALSVQMRYSIPLFTYGTSESAPILNAHVRSHDGKRFVVISNSGVRHARLVDLRFKVGGQALSVLPGLVGYVLPGSTMEWELPARAPVGTGIVVNVNGGDLTLAAASA